MYVCMYGYMVVCMVVWLYVCMVVCMYVCMFVCTLFIIFLSLLFRGRTWFQDRRVSYANRMSGEGMEDDST